MGTKDTRSRKWSITLNNPAEHGINHEVIKERLLDIKHEYWCMADEIGLENGTPHIHLFIAAKNPISFSRLKRVFQEAHIEQARGTIQENRDYVTKSGKWADSDKADTSVTGTFEESGEPPEEPGQGYRSDIAQMYQLIVEGLSNAEIMMENPKLALYVNQMDKIRKDVLEARYSDTFRELDVTYISGETATGKTQSVMEKHGYSSVYHITDYGHYPFDSYSGQSVMCFDEFRSSLPISDMLNYLDGYPLNLPARYANRVACYKTVYIISNISLEEQYPNIQESEPATWQAFLRRIQRVVIYNSQGIVTTYSNVETYLKRSTADFIELNASDIDENPFLDDTGEQTKLENDVIDLLRKVKRKFAKSRSFSQSKKGALNQAAKHPNF